MITYKLELSCKFAIATFLELLITFESGFHREPSAYLKVKLQTDKEWEGNGLQNAFLVQRVLHLFQFDNLDKNKLCEDMLIFPTNEC